MPYKKIGLVAGVDDLLILGDGDYGIIECEGAAEKVGGAFTKMFSTLKFAKLFPSLGTEKDFILFTENAFFKVVNFDRKDVKLESDFDTIKFEFSPERLTAKFQYFQDAADSYVFVIDGEKVVSGLKLESFTMPDAPQFMLFKNGRRGSSVKLSKFDGAATLRQQVLSTINDRIEGK